MNSKFKQSSLIHRKLKISDYEKFKKLFYLSFGKKVSFNFFKWRYFSNKYSFCYGIFKSEELIANVGMFSIKLNNKTNERIYSRHSSMVLKKYRGIGIFSYLLKEVKKKISDKVSHIVMWPNKNNFSNFDINKKNIIKKKYYIYKTFLKIKSHKKTINFPIQDLKKLKNFIDSNNNFFYKDYKYFKNRYLSYKNHEYFLNKLEFNKKESYFILKRNKDSSGLNYVILDHFGSKKLYSRHLSLLKKEKDKLIFLSKKKLNEKNYNLINHIILKIGFLRKLKLKQNKKILLYKDIFLGDLDIFITI